MKNLISDIPKEGFEISMFENEGHWQLDVSKDGLLFSRQYDGYGTAEIRKTYHRKSINLVAKHVQDAKEAINEATI